MFGNYFYYDGESSEDYHLIVCGFDQITDIPSGLEREILKGSTNKFRPVANHMGTTYSDVLIFTVSLMKDLCCNPEMTFTEDEIDNINAWLTSPGYPCLFHMYHDEDTINQYDYYGLFTDVSIYAVGEKVVGLTYTFTTNSPYAWTDLITKSFSCTGDETSISLNVTSSERQGFIYPKIMIHPTGEYTGTRQNITITGVTDGNQSITLNVPKTRITLDSGKSTIRDQISLVTFENIGLADIDYIYWPKLRNGQNTFVINGTCDIEFSYREPRKVGAI